MVELNPYNNKPGYFTLTVAEIIEEIPGVKTFVFQPHSSLSYQSGQFLTFGFNDGLVGEERRSYSFSSSPGLGEPPAVTLKRIPNGKYSRLLIDKVKPGDRLTVSGTAGKCILPESKTLPGQVFFFAAGIGITPVYSLIKMILHCHPSVEVILVYSNTAEKTTVFYKELSALQHQFPGKFTLEWLMSSSSDLRKARLSKWLMPQLMERLAGTDKHAQLFFTCGPFAYMRMVSIALEELGYDEEQIKKEIFDTSRPVFKLLPPDIHPHKVTVKQKGRNAEFTVQYPETILQAAKKNGFNMPYSCEAGRCSSCVLQCIKGTVWMSYNEILTEKEIAQGKVLTCVGYPVGGDVVLE